MNLDPIGLPVSALAQGKALRQAALAAAGQDHAAPGLRPVCRANDRGALVIGPGGRIIDAVCRRAPD